MNVYSNINDMIGNTPILSLSSFATNLYAKCEFLNPSHSIKDRAAYAMIKKALDEKIINRSLGDLDGFVEHLEHYEIKGRLYATNVMEAGKVKNQPIMRESYQMGKNI